MGINRKLRMGMVGGGRDAFIGTVHRMAATIDGEAELVAGAFSRDPQKSRLSGKDLYLDPDRVYVNYKEMVKKEKKLPEKKRIDFVTIVTPNNTHYEIAKTFLEAGFHVVCDKPMTTNLNEAKKLSSIVKKTGNVFALTHNYTGYPMVKQARHLVQTGKLGLILKVVVEYSQGWLLRPIERHGQKQALWRTDPAQTGISCCMGDIGTHAENLARYITCLEIDQVCADITTFVKGRKLDDDGSVLIRYKGGAKGILYASQVSAGEENGLAISVYGKKLSLEWRQEDPNELIIKNPSGPREIYRRGNDYLCKEAKNFTRIPAGHPEGFIEAFANIYREVVRAIYDHIDGKKKDSYDFPTVKDGLVGMAFIETVVASSKSKQKWIKLRIDPD
ncbi:MAG: Gfo/Idh/MocA family oxidoreductase [bacterium]